MNGSKPDMALIAVSSARNKYLTVSPDIEIRSGVLMISENFTGSVFCTVSARVTGAFGVTLKSSTRGDVYGGRRVRF